MKQKNKNIVTAGQLQLYEKVTIWKQLTNKKNTQRIQTTDQ